MNQAVNSLPDGYWKDSKGRLIPIESIKPIDREREDLVHGIVTKARIVNEVLSRFKHEVFADIDAFVELSAERYGAKLGGNKGNVSLLSFDGRYKIVLAVQETLAFDEGIQAAKALIDECLSEWTENAGPELKTIVAGAFEVDKQGLINTKRVLSLRRYDIADDRWQRAMDALSDSLRVQSSKSYVRVYERIGDSEDYRSIALDIAGVPA